jgi:thiol-disulfide isomerase/thioredoxin
MDSANMIRTIALTISFTLMLANSGSLAQKLTVTLRDRGFAQQRFAFDFVIKHDSIYVAQHDRCEPFGSIAAIDSFMRQFKVAWEDNIAVQDPVLKRIDSYVYNQIERQKTGGPWSEAHVWEKYMVPSFLADFEYCRTSPTADKAYLLWPGNAGNIFTFAFNNDLRSEQWKKLNTAYLEMASVIDAYLAAKAYTDSTQLKSLLSLKSELARFRSFYTVNDCLYAHQLNDAFANLSAAFTEGTTSLSYLSHPVQKLAFQYAGSGKTGQALAVLDIAARSTVDSDLPRDSLRAWYQAIDPIAGLARFTKTSAGDAPPIFVPTGKRITLSGHYINLVDGQSIDFSTLNGKTVLLDFWATWCGPCNAEIPDLNSFSQRYAQRNDFAFIAISSDPSTNGLSESGVRDFVRKKGMTYIAVYDRVDSSLTKRFGVAAWPSKYVIDPQGAIMTRPQEGPIFNVKVVEEYLNRKR